MFKNYLKIAFRNLLLHKRYSATNIFGLAVGMASSILLFFYVLHELSFDNFHENGSNIYRIVSERRMPNGITTDIVTPPPLAPALTLDFPEIQNNVRFLYLDNPLPLVSYNDKRFYEKQFFFVDSSVFSVFTIPFSSGKPETALAYPNSVVITKNTAVKYFGTVNPIGKTLRLSNHLDLRVTGVIENFPTNSTINADFMVSFSTLYGWLGKGFVNNWQSNMCQTYILLDQHTSREILEKQLPRFISKHIDKSNPLKNIYLQPFSRIHLHSLDEYNLISEGNVYYVYILSAIALFVLLIACLNYVGLTTAQSVKRFREIGIRRLLGGTKNQLVVQFLSESLLVVIVALPIALLLVLLVLPNFSNVIGKSFLLNYSNHWRMIFLPAVLVLFIGVLSGGIPAFFLSSLKPINTIKAQVKIGSNKITLWKVMIIVQFVLTNLLIAGSLIVYNQLSYMQNKKLGFDGKQVIVVPIRDGNIRQNQDAIKTRLLQLPGIQKVGAAALLPGGPVGKTQFRMEGGSATGTMSMLWIDHDFIKTLRIPISAGRDFSKDFSSDATEGLIINEEAAKQLGFYNPNNIIGKSFELNGSKKGRIIGVVKNFHFTSLQKQIEPIVLHICPWFNYLLIQVDRKNISLLIGNLKNVWNEFDSQNPFEFSFLSDNFNRFYLEEQKLEKVSAAFTLIALIVACIGLFSLSAYAADQRTKEIGIRKMLGASVTSIVTMINKEFILLVFVANILAWPLAYYLINSWLQTYAYKIEMSWHYFVIVGMASLIITVTTVSIQSIKVALADPVKSLKYE